MTYADFYSDVSRVVGLSNEKQALVFIHGYNVAFEDAAFRLGAALLRPWLRGRNRPVQLAFGQPDASTTASTSGTTSGPSRTSAGSSEIAGRVGGAGDSRDRAQHGQPRARRRVSAMAPSRDTESKFSQVVLAAPDIDAGLFPDIAAALRRIAGRVTLYASSGDRALEAARKYDTSSASARQRRGSL